ncbi:GNAT family N-acetyltransferase [Alistipes sp. ZOR0009]|uniref:GNAT family N-acetyltransferase n=1 Tax=Alistipes sp. ZOR0009 TaxID=1339253 RepID=UPI000647CFE6|nr:GNAT family N-acetyltransferase [Alistipes sp. ZOR0009]
MEVAHVESKNKGAFIASENSVKMGEITYAWNASRSVLTIRHTGVADAYKGKGVAHRLVMEVVAFARAEGGTVFPRCPFAKKIFEKNSDLADVLFVPTE